MTKSENIKNYYIKKESQRIYKNRRITEHKYALIKKIHYKIVCGKI